MSASTDVSRPQQDRSKASFERILATTESLLQDDCFDNISISQILETAKVSSGCFYARFSGKEAMLPVLVDRHEQLRDEFLKRSLDPKKWNDLDLRQTIERLVRIFIRFFHEKRGMIRALVMYYRTHPNKLNDQKRRQLDAGYDRVVKLLRAHSEQFSQPWSMKQIQELVAVMFAAIREATLFDYWPFQQSTKTARLSKSLIHMIHASLTCPIE